MEEILKKLEAIDKLLANVTASGDNLMLIAASRQLLKQTYEEAKEGKQ